MIEAVQLAGLFKKGLPPLQGGVMDQSCWFVRMSTHLWSEESKAEAEALSGNS